MSLYTFIRTAIKTPDCLESVKTILASCSRQGFEFKHLEENKIITLDDAIQLAIAKMLGKSDDILTMKTPLSPYFIDIYFLKEKDGFLFGLGGFERNSGDFKLRYVWRDIYYQPYIELIMNIVGSYNVVSFIVGAHR